MSSTTITGALQPLADAVQFADGEQLALVGFLAGCRGLTRQAYTIDLRQFTAWCTSHDLALFGVRRVDIECYARELEALSRGRATVVRRLCTVTGFYRYAEQEGLIERSSAVHVRRPRLDYESNAGVPGPQRARRDARRRRVGWGLRRRPHLPPRPERLAGL